MTTTNPILQADTEKPAKNNALLAFQIFSIIATIAFASGYWALLLSAGMFMSSLSTLMFSIDLPAYGWAIFAINAMASIGIGASYGFILNLIIKFINQPIQMKLGAEIA
jgi:hypothetical protein